VALLGTHTLGSAVASGSGLSGQWSALSPPGLAAALDNGYYSNLLLGDYLRAPIMVKDVQSVQWNSSAAPGLIMLNADLALAYQVGVGLDPASCVRAGPAGDCSSNAGAGATKDQRAALALVQRFAGAAAGAPVNGTAGMAAWYAALVPAMIRMSELGYAESALVAPCALAPACAAGGGGSNVANRTLLRLTLMTNDNFSPPYHGSQVFRQLLGAKVQLALGLPPGAVAVTAVRAGSLLADLDVALDTVANATLIAMLVGDADKALALLNDALRPAIEAGLVGPLVLVRVTSASAGDTGTGGAPAVLPSTQLSGINTTTASLGTALTAAGIVAASALLLCLGRRADKAADIDSAEHEARELRKSDRIGPRRTFSHSAIELSYAAGLAPAPGLDQGGRSSSSGGGGEQEDGDAEHRSRRKRKKQQQRRT
jgi:hypothetical protein